MANTPLPNAAGLGAPNPQRLALDNLIRRELKVGDPGDAMQIAQALLERYRGDPRAAAIGQEARGMPFLQAAPMAAPLLQQAAASGAEWTQACDDVERDLACLATDAILKDVTPELRGWAQAIRSCLQEGYNSARMALDPHNRDKAFAMRRQLNDFARLSRLIGSHTPTMIAYYRSLAKSLDEAANLLLVIMGEALANIGFGGGRYLPQVPYTELQTRRDAAIYALRNLVGSTQMAYGPEDWPRGLDAYRQLVDLLEAQGQNDLRSLLVEGELARTMDELVQRGGDATSDGLRAVGSTALLGLERFRRLVAVGRRGISPESPALYAYLEALQLFADSFESAGGFRLMKIARPPILFYGLYGNTGMDDADRRLVDMITRRSLLADRVDCIASACCSLPGQRVGVVMLDKVLYDIDRAVDLYALGFENFGQTERRAAAFGYLIDSMREGVVVPEAKQLIDDDAELAQNLEALASADLRPALRFAEEKQFDDASRSLLNVAWSAEELMAPLDTSGAKDVVDTLIKTANALDAQRRNPKASERASRVIELTSLYVALRNVERKILQPNRIELLGDESIDDFVGCLRQELCLQHDMETRWDGLVRSMVPNCSSLEQSLKSLVAVVDRAMTVMVGEPCSAQAPINLPPTLETSFDTLVESVERTGQGRPNRVFALQRRRF